MPISSSNTLTPSTMSPHPCITLRPTTAPPAYPPLTNTLNHSRAQIPPNHLNPPKSRLGLEFSSLFTSRLFAPKFSSNPTSRSYASR